MTKSLLACLGIAALLASGCSHGVKGIGRWDDSRPAAAPYKKVLVVGVTQESRMRRSFEEQMTGAINASGHTKAVASIFVGSEMNTELLSKDIVVEMVRRSGADAVLATRMVDATVKEGLTKEEEILKLGPTLTIDQSAGMTAVWLSDFNLTDVPGQLVANEDAKIQSTLFDVAEKGRPVYNVSVDAKFKNENADFIPDLAGNISEAIIRELRHDGAVN